VTEPVSAVQPSAANAARRYGPTVVLVQLLLILITIVGAFHAGGLQSNDQDILPSARHFVDRDWIPGDWYLNLHIPYRYLVDAILGPVVVASDFDQAALLTRLVVYALLVPAAYFFFRSAGLRFSLMLVVLYLFIRHQSLIAGEWIFGGAEAKSFAYGFVLLSTAAFLTQRYLLAFAFAGAAISFHVLVGVYALFSAAGAMLLNYDSYWPQWRDILRRSWLLPLTGAFGIYALINQLSAKTGPVAAKAAEIYVRFRVPHHVLPAAWGGRMRLIELLIAAIVLFVLIYLHGRSHASRFIAAYALCSTVLFMIGLGVYFAGDIPLLKYYWFRFPDVIVPLMSWVLLAMIINDMGDGEAPFRGLPRLNSVLVAAAAPLQPVWSKIFTAAAMAVIALSVAHLLPSRGQDQRTASAGGDAATASDDFANDRTAIQPMYAWIAQHTPRDSAFLVDPMRSDFYMWAERAMFVSFRHSPQTEADIAQWYERLTLCNGGQAPKVKGEITPHFYNLDQAAIRDIATRYGLDYYVGRTRQPLTFERVYSVNGFTLFKIE
jgi:hypothetical protein